MLRLDFLAAALCLAVLASCTPSEPGGATAADSLRRTSMALHTTNPITVKWSGSRSQDEVCLNCRTEADGSAGDFKCEENNTTNAIFPFEQPVANPVPGAVVVGVTATVYGRLVSTTDSDNKEQLYVRLNGVDIGTSYEATERGCSAGACDTEWSKSYPDSITSATGAIPEFGATNTLKVGFSGPDSANGTRVSRYCLSHVVLTFTYRPRTLEIETPADGQLKFGNQKNGTISRALTVTVRNSGEAPVKSITPSIHGVTGGTFTLSSTTPFDLPAGEASAPFSVTFTPSAGGGPASGTLSFTSNEAGFPAGNPILNIPLSGTGVTSAVEESPVSSLPAFPATRVNAVSASQKVTVRNVGRVPSPTDSFNITGVSIGSGQPFDVTPKTGFPLAVTAGSSGREFEVTFKPTIEGASQTGTLTITTDDPDRPTINLALSGAGVKSTISLDPTTRTFAALRVGDTSAWQPVAVSNTGSARLNVSSVAISGPFEVSSTAGFTVEPNATPHEISVRFHPTAEGANQPGVLTFNTDDPDNLTATVDLWGTGVKPTIELNPTSLSFDAQRVGSFSAWKPLLVDNGGSERLDVSSVSVTGPFEVSSTAAFSVEPNGTPKELMVRFKPVVAGANQPGVITFNSNDPDRSTATVSLSGTGVKPTLVLSPDPITFAPQRVDTISAWKPVTVSNTGTERLDVSSVAISGPFEVSSTAGFSVDPSGTPKELMVRFKPTLEGANQMGSLTFNTNEPGKTTANFDVSGSGVKPNLVVTHSTSPTASLNFGEQRVNTTSGSLTVTLSNATGSGPIHISSIAVGAGEPFAVSPSAAFTLEKGETRQLSVTFSPKAEGVLSGSLTFNTDYAATSTVTVPLSGRGVKPTLQVSTVALDFGLQAVGSRGTSKPVKVSNTGSGTLRITSVSVSANYEIDSPPSFDLTDASETSRERTLLVTFYPSVQGSLPGTVTFNTNDPAAPTVTINLSGTGEVLLSVPSDVINFGDVRVGTTAEHQVTFTNSGSVPITLNRVLFASDRFTLEGLSSPIELKTGLPSVALKVKFSPAITGEVTGRITVESTATNSPHTLYLVGRGTEAKVQISLPNQPGQSALDFGNVEVNSTRQETVRLTNTGGAPLDVTAARVVTRLADGGTVTSNSPFEYRGPSSRADIAPDGGFIEFPVAFAPTQNASSSATLVINSNAVNNQVELPLIGNGVAARFTLSSYSLAFGNQRAGAASPPQRVFITNTGKATLKIQGFSFTNLDFSVSAPSPLPSPSSPMEIPEGQTRSIDVNFTPSKRGDVTGTISILSNAIESVSSVTVTGKGLDGLIGVLEPLTDINFGGVEVGASSTRRMVRLTNSGDVSLTLVSATIQNSSEENPFIISGFNSGLTLNPGDVHEFFITFRPAVNGYQSATLVIQSNSFLNPKHNLTVAGTGEGAEVELLRPSVNFIKTNVGLTDTQTLSIRNKGVRTLQIYDISFESKTVLDGGTAGIDNMATDFSVGRSADGGSLFTMSVDAGAVVPVDLKFAPTAVGFREARGVINSNAKTVKFDVSGEGTSASLVVEPSDGGLTFQGVLLGSSSTAQLKIINEGTGSVDIDNITLSQTGDTFKVTHSDFPIPLPPKASETLFVTFSPTETQPSASAQLLVVPSSTNVPRVLVNIVGLGVREPVSVESELDFGQQLVENTSLPRTLNVSNNTDSRINLTSVGVVGTDCAQFTPAPLPTSSVELVRGTPFPLKVTFRPRSLGDVNCVLKLSFAQFSKQLEIPLHGKGIPTVLSINPATLDFGGVRAATGSREEPITLMNLSSDPITLGLPEMEYSIGESFIFSWASLEGEVLLPGQPVIKKVKYQPTVEGSSETKIHLGTTSPLKPRAVPFKMLGKATKRVLHADVDSLDFGRLDAKAPAQTKTVTITNKSPQPQRAVVALRTLEGSPFALDAKSFAESIPPEGTVTFTVTFDPDKAGDAENEVLVRLQDLSEPEVQIPVKGIGRVLTGVGGGCSCGSTEAGTAGLLAMLALVGLSSRRRRRE